MVHEMIDGTYRQTNLPNESPEYLSKREDLRHAEIELMKQRERVAGLRRALPKGATIHDYKFLEGPTALDDGDEPVKRVRLSELFTAPDRSLVIYHFMFGKKQTSPCPMCTAWIDSFNGVAHHLAQNIDLAIVAAADPATLRAHARKRGWDKLRLLSAGENTFKYDLGSEDRAGHQDSTISVFTRDGDGTLRHFYSVHPRLADDIEERGIDEYNPIWNVMDLTPQGRGNWIASLDYGTRVQAPRIEMKPTDRGPAAVSDEAGRDHKRSIHGLHGVRYQSTDVQRAVDFYTTHLGFTLEHQQLPAFATVSLGDFKLLLSGPGASGSRQMPDGRRQEAGGWNRVVLHVADVAREIERLKKAGLKFRNEMETGPGGRQIQLEDPDGNPIELFEPARR